MTKQMFMLGRYKFSGDTASPKTKDRRTDAKWKSLEIAGDWDKMQFMGPGNDEIVLKGRIFPLYKGGPHEIEMMREEQKRGVPLNLSNGQGFVLGTYVIISVSDNEDQMLANGFPTHIDFSLTLKRYEAQNGQ